jgi:hypothetical protein
MFTTTANKLPILFSFCSLLLLPEIVRSNAWSFFGGPSRTKEANEDVFLTTLKHHGKVEETVVVDSLDDQRVEQKFEYSNKERVVRDNDDDDDDSVKKKKKKKLNMNRVSVDEDEEEYALTQNRAKANEERKERKRKKKLDRERKKNAMVEEEALKKKTRERNEREEGESAAGSLHEAIDDDDFDELEDLLRWKPNLNEPCKRIGKTKDFTPIMKAAHLGRYKMIDLLLDYGANANEVDSIGYSVLMRAVMSKSLESVKVLVDAGAVVTYVQKTAMMDLGLSAMRLAQMTNRRDMVDALEQAGANPNDDEFERRERKREELMEKMKRDAEESGIEFDSIVTPDKMNVKRGDDDVEILISHEGKNETVLGSENLKKWRDEKFREERENARKAKLKKETTFGEEMEKESMIEDEDVIPTNKDEL